MMLLHQFGANIYPGNRLQTLFHKTIKHGQETSVALLLELGAITKESSQVTFRVKQPPLHTAVEAGWESIAQSLLDHGAAIRALLNLGYTALFLAARNEHSLMVEFLLKNGADIYGNRRTERFRETFCLALDWNVYFKKEAMVQMLLEKGEYIGSFRWTQWRQWGGI
jgi:ankyrin repeat protein